VNPELRRALSNFFLKVASLPVEKACRLVVVVVAAQALGTAAFGMYQYAATLTALLAISTELGLGVWTTRALARDLDQAPKIVGTSLRLRSLGIPLYALALAVALAMTGAGEARRVLFLLGVAALAQSLIEYLGAIFRGHERLRDEAWLNSVRAVLVLVAALGGLRVARSVTGLAGGVMVGALATVAIGFRLLHARYGLASASRRVFDPDIARAARREASALWVAGLLSTLYFRCDVILLRAFRGDAEVGVYSAAYRLFEAVMIVPSVVLAVTFPRLARFDADRRRQARFQAALAASLLAVGALLGAAFHLGRGPLIHLAFGSAFAPAAASLRVLSLGLPLLFLNFALTHTLIARNLERPYLVIVALMLVLNVCVNLAAIPRWGGPGAALATVLTETALTACCLFTLARSPPGQPQA
jgi:O-antigen/teichoic acid export membrane protein